MSPPPKPRRGTEKLEVLAALLDDAAEIVASLASEGDPLLVRLGHVFARMPAEDREAILAVLEREVDFRLVARETAPSTGFDIVRPDPHARLYLRVVGCEVPLLSMARDDMARAMHRAFRVMGLMLAPPLRDDWEAAMLDALATLEPDERRRVRQLFGESLALIDRVEQGGAAVEAARA